PPGQVECAVVVEDQDLLDQRFPAHPAYFLKSQFRWVSNQHGYLRCICTTQGTLRRISQVQSLLNTNHVPKTARPQVAGMNCGSQPRQILAIHNPQCAIYLGSPRCRWKCFTRRDQSRSVTTGSGTMWVRPESGSISKSLPSRKSALASRNEWRK